VAVGVDDLVEREVIEDPSAVRLLIAAAVGPVRLIDNCAGVRLTPGTLTESGRTGRQLERIG
jgi:hypothetical protein